MNFLPWLLAICCAAAGKREPGRGSKWWGIAKAGEPNNLLPMSPGILTMDQSVHETLRPKQRRLAQKHHGVLAAVAKGAKMAVEECQHQFKNRQWNCSTKNYLRGKNLFGKIVDTGCPETAFIYAITSAAVTHAVARGCSEGSIGSCMCDYSHQSRGPAPTRVTHHQARGPTNTLPGVRDWEWGGCSDNLVFGYTFSRAFVDAGEKGRNLREKMNIHNNEAGRMHVSAGMRQECKCHGMSGSCTYTTCWMRLPSFREVGDNLKDRFDGASRVMLSNAGSIRRPATGKGRKKHNKYKQSLKPYDPNHKPPGAKDLVFLEESPNFCKRNPKLGIQGTSGRTCNDTSIGVDGCAIMCCGRGYKTQEMIVTERCACTFEWCCEVKCELCRTKKNVHTCL